MLIFDRQVSTDKERVQAVNRLFDNLDGSKLSNSDLEKAATYILYGKSDDDKNVFEKRVCFEESSRYSSYRHKKPLSLDELLEDPIFDQTSVFALNDRRNYKKLKPSIDREQDQDIPGMEQLWESIDRLSASLDEDKKDFSNYKLKHQIFQLRFDQYILKESYRPAKRANPLKSGSRSWSSCIDWDSDAEYWISFEEWKNRTSGFCEDWKKDIRNYETRNGGREVKWVIRRHNFDWEDEWHVSKFMRFYASMCELYYNKLDSWGKMLVLDFQKYFGKVEKDIPKEWKPILKLYLSGYTCADIAKMPENTFSELKIRSICGRRTPRMVAREAIRERLQREFPDKYKKKCPVCGGIFPCHELFFNTNWEAEDGFKDICRRCEKK